MGNRFWSVIIPATLFFVLSVMGSTSNQCREGVSLKVQISSPYF
jgi:hypothetical protein